MNILFVPLCVFGLHQIHISVFRHPSSSRVFLFFPSPLNVCLFRRHCRLVGSSGVEPPTSCLSGMRSNLLSYEPLLLAQPGSTFDLRFKSLWTTFGFSTDGGDEGIRTLDPLLAGQVLSQLSYTPIFEVSNSPWKSNNNWNVQIVSASSCLFLCELRKICFNLSCSP